MKPTIPESPVILRQPHFTFWWSCSVGSNALCLLHTVQQLRVGTRKAGSRSPAEFHKVCFTQNKRLNEEADEKARTAQGRVFRLLYISIHVTTHMHVTNIHVNLPVT